MLKLSTKDRYGIKALYELARCYDSGPVTIREIADRHRLPMPFLVQVLNRLKRGGIVASRRGATGGYLLARDPGEITLGDVVRVLEGPFGLCSCLQHQESVKAQERSSHCITASVFRQIGDTLESAFDAVTLKDLADDEGIFESGQVC